MAGDGTASGRNRARDDLLAAALAAGAKIVEAAQAAGVSERTAHRRLADPAFRQRVEDARRDHVRHIGGRLTALSDEALDALAELLHAPRVPAAVRCRAALGVLAESLRWREQADVEQRLQAIEAALSDRGLGVVR